MDKYEYRVRAEQIKSLLAKKEYVEAMKVVDTIDWHRVKSISMLCTVSEVYKINRKYEESREILLLAYERYPTGRMIVYALCELSIKMEDFVQAVEYYKEYVQIAPKDTGRYILQYKLYEAQDVSIEERIEVLEEFKKRDYREKWAYELAYLYHRIGLGTKCVEECDELILWFGEGKYVMKAMELKMLHESLSPLQEEKFQNINPQYSQIQPPNESVEEEIEEAEQIPIEIKAVNASFEPTKEIPSQDIAQAMGMDMEVENMSVPTVNVGQYNTINLQEELAKSMQELLGEVEPVDLKTAEHLLQYGNYQNFTAELPIPPEETEPVGKEVFYEQQVAEEEQITLEDEEKSEEVDELTLEEAIQHVKGLEDKELESMLKQEYDGQITLSLPKEDLIEKQITGQLNIEDILAEWEKMKKSNEKRRMEEAKKRSLAQTNDIMSQLVGVIPGLEPMKIEDGPEAVNTPTSSNVIPMPVPPTPKIAKVVMPDIPLEEHLEQEEDNETSYLEEGGYLSGSDIATTELPHIQLLDEDSIAQELGQQLALEEDTKEEQIEDAVEYEEEDFETEECEEDLESEDSEIEDLETEIEEEEEEEIPEQIVKKNLKKSSPIKTKTMQSVAPVARDLTAEEEKILAAFIDIKPLQRQILRALASFSMTPITGNMIITGLPTSGREELAMSMLKVMQLSDQNFTGRIAKIKAEALNKKDIHKTVQQLSGSVLYIEDAGKLSTKCFKELPGALEEMTGELLIILVDEKEKIDKKLHSNDKISLLFNVCIDIPEYSNDDLVAYALGYARSLNYSVDEMGTLAVYTKIGELQLIDYAATIEDAREIIDKAINNVRKKNISHLMDVMLAKRYDEDDCIILREKDFLNKKERL